MVRNLRLYLVGNDIDSKNYNNIKILGNNLSKMNQLEEINLNLDMNQSEESYLECIEFLKNSVKDTTNKIEIV